ncbi:MAG TPA: aminotransferase DegT [Desulfotomaculum sp.]|nr:MAG: DegT/DnrJ/EryC1/StrS aminotransferase [Desulfotomaculum sp. 46_80]HAG11527.1 aminotransferase DegT [Desulfotomaculum sp.]HBY03769.1 LegC family aminotransferase [Desulfotomaculum sp.]
MPEIKIPLDWPNIGELEKKYLLEAIDSGFVSSSGPLIAEFEARFASFISAEHAVAVSSGTCGLHLALRLLGIGPGDEVIVPSLTFIATVNPVTYVGATPVVVDVTPDTWTLDPVKTKEAITPRTKAIIPVHLYGNPADLNSISNLANNYGIYVIEDAAESLGATFSGKMTGTFGHIGVFSFNGNKVITTGSGGMIVTGDSKLAERARVLVNQGREKEQMEYLHTEIGYNYRLTNLQAALGLAQLERLPQFLKAKKNISDIYHNMLDSLPGVIFQKELPEARSSWWLTSVLIDPEEFGEKKTALMKRLISCGIQVRPFFVPMHRQPCFLEMYLQKNSIADELYNRGINLPSATFLTDESVREVCDSIALVSKAINISGDAYG